MSDRLKLIQHQIKTFQASDDNGVLDQALGQQVHLFKESRIKHPKSEETKISKLRYQEKIF